MSYEDLTVPIKPLRFNIIVLYAICECCKSFLCVSHFLLVMKKCDAALCGHLAHLHPVAWCAVKGQQGEEQFLNQLLGNDYVES